MASKLECRCMRMEANQFSKAPQERMCMTHPSVTGAMLVHGHLRKRCGVWEQGAGRQGVDGS